MPPAPFGNTGGKDGGHKMRVFLMAVGVWVVSVN
jgi:hypothetical protein